MRWADPGTGLQLQYEHGWIAEVAVLIMAAGGDLTRVSLERLQETAWQAQDGLPWLLEPELLVYALMTGTLTGGDFRHRRHSLPAELLTPPEGGPAAGRWLLPYPPQPELPEQLPAGQYMLWNSDGSIGWLELDQTGCSWQVFPGSEAAVKTE